MASDTAGNGRPHDRTNPFQRSSPLNSSIVVTAEPEERHGVTFREAFWVWVRVAALSFGGPASQIAVMHRILVEEKRWIGETRFLHALNYCMLLLGQRPNSLQSTSAGCCIGYPAGWSRALCSSCRAISA